MRHRCLIPASCFFEWKRTGEKKKKPYCIRPKDEGLFAFAGLWEHLQDEGVGKKTDSCTIVTTRANEAVTELHDRMPVIIGEADFDLWLNRSVDDPEQLQPLLAPISSPELEIYPVGLEVNTPGNDSEEVIRIVGGPGTCKSILALLRTKRYIESKRRYIFLVYNHVLHQAIRHLF
jgi:putative SOS response-associated peptidase YedK